MNTHTLGGLAALLLLIHPPASPASFTADIEDVPLAPNSFYNGSDGAGGFTSRGIHFGNEYIPAWGSWSGFSASNVNDPTTAGFNNSYAVTSGTGVGGSGNYAVGYDGAGNIATLPSPATVAGLFVNNTTYANLSMRDGDQFAKQFGGASGTDSDWFLLTISGQNAGGSVVGSVDFYLADFRATDPSGDYLITDWTWVDLTTLGRNVKTLQFSLSSTDNTAGFMNTPAYFALDELTVIPEPATWALLVSGCLIAALRHRRLHHVD